MRRGNNEGNIRQRKDGTWEARYTAGYNDQGKQVQKSIYGKTRQEVRKKLTEILNNINKGRYASPSDITVAEWLEQWLVTYNNGNIHARTYTSYEGYIYNHFKPGIGKIKLQKLTTENLQMFYNEKLLNGRSDGKGGLSAKTIRNMNNMFHAAIKQAQINHLVVENVCDGVKIPTVRQKEIRYLTKDEQVRIMENTKAERLGFAVELALATGMREAEICGLKWSDIKWNNDSCVINIKRIISRISHSKNERTNKKNIKKTLVIEAETKTEKSKREIPVIGNTFSNLKKYQEKQNLEKQTAGSAYMNNDYLFCNEIGQVIEPSQMRKIFLRIAKRADVENVNFHTLRHTFATRALESGAQIKVVSDILGHTTTKITMDLYCHTSMDEKKKTIEQIQNYLNS